MENDEWKITNYEFVTQTNSTNTFLKQKMSQETLPEGYIVYSDFQTAGKGQAGNFWEAERCKNLIFSILLQPMHIKIEEQFIISQIVSVAIKEILDKIVGDISIKWSNDIYFQDKKLAGILIENTLCGSKLQNSVVGVGLNVNQENFVSDAPNPVSLLQITGKEQNRENLRKMICENILKHYHNTENYNFIQQQYLQSLYCRAGFHHFTTPQGETFEAKIETVKLDGQLILQTRAGTKRGFYFKEVILM